MGRYHFSSLGIGLTVAIAVTTASLLATPRSAEASQPWQGTTDDRTNVRSGPSTGAPVVDVLPAGSLVTVQRWVSGEEVETQNNTWAQIGEGQFVYSARVHKVPPDAPPPPPEDAQFAGKWIDANLTEQTLTAYVGSTPVHVAVMSSGRPDYPTPRGTFTILRRVANETMTSAGLPWIRDYYKLDNVLFTQYFTSMGAAIHEAWWKAPDSFGIPTSHACIGLPHDEAEWFWNWANVGTPVYVHQ